MFSFQKTSVDTVVTARIVGTLSSICESERGFRLIAYAPASTVRTVRARVNADRSDKVRMVSNSERRPA